MILFFVKVAGWHLAANQPSQKVYHKHCCGESPQTMPMILMLTHTLSSERFSFAPLLFNNTHAYMCYLYREGERNHISIMTRTCHFFLVQKRTLIKCSPLFQIGRKKAVSKWSHVGCSAFEIHRSQLNS
jgi:hypothetical protein